MSRTAKKLPDQSWCNGMLSVVARLEVADTLYQTALRARNELIVGGYEAGYSTDQIAYYSGVSQPRVVQIVNRASLAAG